MIDHFKYTDKELAELISSMVILIDTREKKCEHITNYFDRKKVVYKKKALDFGDYSFMIPKNEALSIPRDLYFNRKTCIERKASLEEISGNLTKGRDRFEKELSLLIEKLELPNIDTIKISREMCGYGTYGTFMDLGFGDLRCVDDKVEYENIRKKEREMTLSDIERKLGYKIKLVSEKE